MVFACNVVLPDNQFEVSIHSTFDIWCGTWPFGQRGLSSNQARPLLEFQVVTMWLPWCIVGCAPSTCAAISLQTHYTEPNEVADKDVACQVGKAYNICPPASWFFLKDLDAITRLWLFEFELVFLGDRGVINATSFIWGLQRLCHYVMHAPGPVFLVPNATIISVYELRVSRVTASISEGSGYYYAHLWSLGWHQTLWLVLVCWMRSWSWIWIRLVCRAHGSGACIYTPLFFTSSPIYNHSLCFWALFVFSLLHHYTLLRIGDRNVGKREWSAMGVIPFCYA